MEIYEFLDLRLQSLGLKQTVRYHCNYKVKIKVLFIFTGSLINKEAVSIDVINDITKQARYPSL